MGLFGGPSVEKVMERGTPAPAQLAGIQVRYVSDDNSTRRVDEYAVQFAGGIVGIRQMLLPDDMVRLGMPLTVLVHDGAGYIDWAATCAAAGTAGTNEKYRWKALKEVPAAGIVDEEDRLTGNRKKGGPATVTIEAIERRSVMFGLGSAIDVRAGIVTASGQSYVADIKNVSVAFYATHLCVVGATLPGWVRDNKPDKVAIDWPAAAQANPGVGVPPVEELRRDRTQVETASMGAQIDVRAEVDNAANTTLIEGVSLETLAAIEVGTVKDRVPPKDYDDYAIRYGLAPGQYTAATAALQQRMRSGDWKVGAAYGEAVTAARKRAK